MGVGNALLNDHEQMRVLYPYKRFDNLYLFIPSGGLVSILQLKQWQLVNNLLSLEESDVEDWRKEIHELEHEHFEC